MEGIRLYLIRKIIQISNDDSCLFALCDDGTLWFINSPYGRKWTQMRNIPQGNDKGEISDVN